MEKRLANKLLWTNLFESAALPSHEIGRKSKSRLTDTLFNVALARIGFYSGLKFAIRLVAFLLFSSGVWTEARAERFSINYAISQAVLTNQGIGEASANRRATETELRQTQSTWLPQVRLEARAGPERFTQQILPPPLGNGQWLSGKSGSVVVRQLLFDGFASIHDTWRQAARVNAASFRVRERSELTALDAAEAYIDVVRFMRLVALADQNVANHEELFSHVKSRYSGGLAGEGDLQQALERVEAAKATRVDFQRSLDDARSKYRKIIGLEAINVVFPGPLRGLPRSKDDALAVALRRNPTLLAAESDKEAAKQAFRATDGAFVPSVSLEGRASHSIDADTFIGKRDDVAGKLVMSWDIYRGGQDSWHRAEMAERYTEETMRQARLQRDALESVDKAWAARTITVNRIAALTRQLAADRKTIDIYRKEYEIKQRSLIDLLNAENQYFNAAASLTSARGVVVFADYQLLAAMGSLLDYLKTAIPIDAAPLDTIPLGALPVKLPPFLIWPATFAGLPHPGSEPLYANTWPNAADAGNLPPGATFEQRWSQVLPLERKEWMASAALPGQKPVTASDAGITSDLLGPGQFSDTISGFVATASSMPLELHPGFSQN
jgi:outer membrane protein, adhesin transport system